MTRRAVALAVSLAAAFAATPVAAEEAKPAGTTYHFGTSPSRTTILFESETSVETIHGVTRTMSGDPITYGSPESRCARSWNASGARLAQATSAASTAEPITHSTVDARSRFKGPPNFMWE